MEAKDTVMSLEVVKESIPLKTVEIVGQKLGYDGYHIWKAFRANLERQAEISFKAGVEQGRREAVKLALDNDLLCSLEAAKQYNCVACPAFYAQLKELG